MGDASDRFPYWLSIRDGACDDLHGGRQQAQRRRAPGEHPHPEPVLGQPSHQLRADHAGGTRDQGGTHGSVLLSPRAS
jgi:hypothetical protein